MTEVHVEAAHADRGRHRARPSAERRLLGDGLALSTSAGVSAVIGMVSWVIAARLMSQAEVGEAAAFVSAFLLVAGFAQVNLGAALLRWLPRAGPASATLVLRCTAAVVLTGTVGATVYLVLPGSGLIFLAGTGSTAPSVAGWLMFTAATVAWVVVQIQDFALVGLGRAWWATVRNVVVAGSRLAILLALGSALTTQGTVWSWLAPLLACAAVLTAVIPRLGSRHGALAGTSSLPDRREVLRFLGPTYVGTMATTLLFNQVPLVVTARFGTETGAAFFIAWQAVTVVEVVAIYFVTALSGEVARAPEAAAELAHSTRRRMLLLFLPALGLGVLLAAPALSIFGPGYVASAPALRVLLVGLAFRLVVVHALGVRQAVGQAVRFARLHIITAGLVLVAVLMVPGYAGEEPTGVLMSVAYAYLTVQCVAALAVLYVDSSARRRARSTSFPR
ncbi:MAG: hypothetical protein H0W37_07070 [Pseudonocardiales bacterium]|nr:hypothetical protein [Pseudonocardiales bacterium]